MGEFFGALNAADLSAAAILAIAILMVLWGYLVPRSTVDYIKSTYNERLTDAKQEIADWRAAHETSETARELLLEQNRKLIEQGKTTEHLLLSLQESLGLPDPSRGRPLHLPSQRDDNA